MKLFLYYIFSCAGVLLSREIFAIDVESPTGILPSVGVDPGSTIAMIISYAISLAAIFAVISITYGSIQMILAAGEEEKIKKARMIMIYSFIGVIVAGMAYGIVQAITRLQF